MALGDPEYGSQECRCCRPPFPQQPTPSSYPLTFPAVALLPCRFDKQRKVMEQGFRERWESMEESSAPRGRWLEGKKFNIDFPRCGPKWFTFIFIPLNGHSSYGVPGDI